MAPIPGWSRILLLLAVVPGLVLGIPGYPLAILAGLAALGWFATRGAHPMWRRLFVQAAVYGTVGEAVCVMAPWGRDGTGLWIYAFPTPFGWKMDLPVWLPLVWGNLFVLFGAVACRVTNGYAAPRGRGAEFFRFLAVLLIMSYAAAMYRVVDPRILAFFTPFFCAFLLYWNTPRDLTAFLIAALLGSFGEILAMRQGLWIYTRPVFAGDAVARALGVPGIPLSLAMAWGLSHVFLLRMTSRESR